MSRRAEGRRETAAGSEAEPGGIIADHLSHTGLRLFLANISGSFFLMKNTIKIYPLFKQPDFNK